MLPLFFSHLMVLPELLDTYTYTRVEFTLKLWNGSLCPCLFKLFFLSSLSVNLLLMRVFKKYILLNTLPRTHLKLQRNYTTSCCQDMRRHQFSVLGMLYPASHTPPNLRAGVPISEVNLYKEVKLSPSLFLEQFLVVFLFVLFLLLLFLIALICTCAVVNF